MKKILLTLILLLTPMTLANGVGYISYEYIYQKLPISKEYQKKIDAKTSQIKAYEKATLTQVDNEKDLEKKSQIIKARKEGLVKLQKEYLTLKEEQKNVILQKVKTASDIVLAQKGLDIIINSKIQVTGGVDCTLDVMKVIK